MVRLTFVSILFRIKLLKHNFRIKNRIKSSFVASKVRDEREREKKKFPLVKSRNLRTCFDEGEANR